MNNLTFLQELLNTVADQSRVLLPRVFFLDDPEQELHELAEALMSGRGEASGVVLARQLSRQYGLASADIKLKFFRYLADTLKPDPEAVRVAAERYISEPGPDHLAQLQNTVASPLQEFFRRVNIAPGGTAEIVRMRSDLLGFMRMYPDIKGLNIIDQDIMHLLQSWFNRGFLVLHRINWTTPANILDKIIAYEAVHQINGWDDLRRRLNPADRRCFAFFHPSLIDEPLIFVQVALTNDAPSNITSVLAMEAPKAGENAAPTTAVFYSISNCQNGLRGISFGNFLIKQVVEELSRECPSLRHFVTLSPVPGFAAWLERIYHAQQEDVLDAANREAAMALSTAEWVGDATLIEKLQPAVETLAATYLLAEKTKRGQPTDAVARFHLGNGARLERINWPADLSSRGLRQAYGLMVNYLYVLGDIEKNHEAYAHDGTIAAGRSVKSIGKLKLPNRHASAKDEEKLPPETDVTGGKPHPAENDGSP